MWWHSESCEWTVVRAARGFRRIGGNRFLLYADPKLDPFEVELFHQACGNEIEALERLFGFRLRAWRLYPGRLRVYLFRSAEDVTRMRGRPAGGYASWPGWYIVVNLASEWRELLRHELAHIFAGRWNLSAPRVLEEGLAVWVQRTEGGYPIDDCVRSRRSSVERAIDRLLGPESKSLVGTFRYYMLAGSFTGFLIREFGWEAYQCFYQDSAVQWRFRRAFKRHFGVTLTTAVGKWLDELDRSPLTAIPLQTSL